MGAGLWVALIAIALAFLRYRGRKAKQLNLPPGPPGIPVLGNMLALGGRKLLHENLAEMSKQYGPLMFLRFGSTPCVVASSPEAFKQILKDQDRVFASRRRNWDTDIFYSSGRGLAFGPYGERWRHMRKVAMLELLTQKKINEFEGSRTTEMSAMVRAMCNHSKVCGSKPLGLRVMLKAFAFNFMTQIVLGRRFFDYPGSPEPSSANDSVNSEEAKQFTHLIDEILEIIGTVRIGDYIPSLSFLNTLTGERARVNRIHRRCDKFLRRLLEEHRQHPKEENLDFVDVLLRLPGVEGGQYLEDHLIKTLSMEMLVAGTDTSSTAVEWTMSQVLRNPEIYAKVRAELDAVVGKERLVTEADIPNLPYLRAVVKEGLRLHAVAPLLVPHFSTEHTKVMGYDIPQSTTVFFNVWAAHRDPTVWEQPMEFRPDRFLHNSEIDVKGLHYELLPFGSGRRVCPATGLALTVKHYTLARLFQAFDWSLPHGMKPQDLDMEETPGLTVSRVHALEPVLTPRLSEHVY